MIQMLRTTKALSAHDGGASAGYAPASAVRDSTGDSNAWRDTSTVKVSGDSQERRQSAAVIDHLPLPADADIVHSPVKSFEHIRRPDSTSSFAARKPPFLRGLEEDLTWSSRKLLSTQLIIAQLGIRVHETLEMQELGQAMSTFVTRFNSAHDGLRKTSISLKHLAECMSTSTRQKIGTDFPFHSH